MGGCMTVHSLPVGISGAKGSSAITGCGLQVTLADFKVAETRVQPSAMREVALEVCPCMALSACIFVPCTATTCVFNQQFAADLPASAQLPSRSFWASLIGHHWLSKLFCQPGMICVCLQANSQGSGQQVHHDYLLWGEQTGAMLTVMCTQVPKVRWSDVGGLEGVKQGLKEAVQWPHLHPDALIRLGAQPPRGTFTHTHLQAPPSAQCIHAKHVLAL